MKRSMIVMTFLLSLATTPTSAHRSGQIAGCTTDGLIHVETGAAVERHVAATVKLKEPGARLRNISRLRLPCGFRVESSDLGNLVLTNGTEHRRYVENNAFGFAPAFGFQRQLRVDQTLSFQKIPAADVTQDSCTSTLKKAGLPGVCASFGSPILFFAIIKAADGRQRLVQIRASSKTDERFALAEIGDPVVSLSFVQPPDAGGGTVTVLTADGDNIFRFYIDSMKA